MSKECWEFAPMSLKSLLPRLYCCVFWVSGRFSKSQGPVFGHCKIWNSNRSNYQRLAAMPPILTTEKAVHFWGRNSFAGKQYLQEMMMGDDAQALKKGSFRSQNCGTGSMPLRDSVLAQQ
jgi:hypothetical protein